MFEIDINHNKFLLIDEKILVIIFLQMRRNDI